MIATKLKSLQAYEIRLLGELKESATQVLELLNKVEHLPQESEAYEDAYGELYARALQVELDASDLRKVMDEVRDALPEDDAQPQPQ